MPRHLLSASPLVWVALAISPAFADDDPKLRLAEFSFSIHQAETTGNFGNNAFYHPPAECDRALRAGDAAKLGPTDTFIGGGGATITWRRAPEICARYSKLHALAALIGDLASSWTSIAAYASVTRADGSPDPSVRGDAYRASVEEARRCVKRIDEGLAKGIPGDVNYAPTGNDSEPRYTLVTMKAKCADWVRFGSGAADTNDKRVAAELAALRAKWSKLGVTGDRLEYLVKYGHNPVFGKGCVELFGQGFKTAPAFYDIGQDDLAWIVYKTEFSGDKRTRYSTARYTKRGNWRCL